MDTTLTSENIATDEGYGTLLLKVVDSTLPDGDLKEAALNNNPGHLLVRILDDDEEILLKVPSFGVATGLKAKYLDIINNSINIPQYEILRNEFIPANKGKIGKTSIDYSAKNARTILASIPAGVARDMFIDNDERFLKNKKAG
jgi:hypothetical protein